ncbi:Uncharacterised protein [Wolbachia endosymbiont wPip_Mol of Culex molestus]|nr:Uncharacterised protein [Wolbachia endosymbiont wPip_Mol of Culex molestus]
MASVLPEDPNLRHPGAIWRDNFFRSDSGKNLKEEVTGGLHNEYDIYYWRWRYLERI